MVHHRRRHAPRPAFAYHAACGSSHGGSSLRSDWFLVPIRVCPILSWGAESAGFRSAVGRCAPPLLLASSRPRRGGWEVGSVGDVEFAVLAVLLKELVAWTSGFCRLPLELRHRLRVKRLSSSTVSTLAASAPERVQDRVGTLPLYGGRSVERSSHDAVGSP